MGCIICNLLHMPLEEAAGERWSVEPVLDPDPLFEELANDIVIGHPEIIEKIERIRASLRDAAE